MTIKLDTALPLDLLALVLKEGPLPLRYNLDLESWEFCEQGQWSNDRHRGRKFDYLRELWHLLPPQPQWDRLRRQLTSGFSAARYQILQEWRPYLSFSASGTVPVTSDQLPASGASPDRAVVAPPGL